MGQHADAVTQKRPAGERTGWVYGQHPDTKVTTPQFRNIGTNQGRLPRTRRAGNTHDQRMAGQRASSAQNLARFRRVVLDQRDGARQGSTFPLLQGMRPIG